MKSIFAEIFYLWSEQGEKPRKEALLSRFDHLHSMTEAGESGERLWDACMDYADLLEQQAFEMGFVWSAGLREELACFRLPPRTVYEKSPASGA